MDPVEKEVLLQSSPEGVLRLYESSDVAIDDIPEEIERLLLKRGERLIDLALAQYSHNKKIIAELFARGMNADDKTLRLACLKTNFRPSFGEKFPYFLFESEEDENFSQYFSNQITHEEISQICHAHPDRQFILSFLERGALWDLLESHQPGFFACIVEQLKEMGENRSYDVFLAIQVILLRVPITEEWLDAVRGLRWGLEPRSYEFIDGVIERWTVSSRVLEGGSTDDLRYFLYRCKFAWLTNGEIKKYLRDEDVAIRLAAYASYGNFSKSDIRRMYKLDGDRCLDAVRENESFWRNDSNREELGELSDTGSFRESMKAQPRYDYTWTENKEEGRRRKSDYWGAIAVAIFFIWLIFF